MGGTELDTHGLRTVRGSPEFRSDEGFAAQAWEQSPQDSRRRSGSRFIYPYRDHARYLAAEALWA